LRKQNTLFAVTSANPTLMSSPKIEDRIDEEEEYDEDGKFQNEKKNILSINHFRHRR
jgi:hypothetical protein